MSRRDIVAYDFLIFADICVTFCELPFWEICIPRIVQAEEILIGFFVDVNQSKKWAVDVPWKNCIRLYYSFRPSRLNVSPSETKIEPDRRLVINL